MIEGQKFKITVYLVAIFLIGCITGGFATSAFRGPPRSPMLGNMAGRQMDRMKEELTLSQEQVERIEPILMEINEAALAVRRSSMAEFARIYSEMSERVEAELTPEQVEIFRVRQEERRLRAESIRRGKKVIKGPGGPDGGWHERNGPPPPKGPEGDPPPPETVELPPPPPPPPNP